MSMSKQINELRNKCNLEADNSRTKIDELLAYAHYENMLHAIGGEFTKRRRIIFKKLEKKFYQDKL